MNGKDLPAKSNKHKRRNIYDKDHRHIQFSTNETNLQSKRKGVKGDTKGKKTMEKQHRKEALGSPFMGSK